MSRNVEPAEPAVPVSPPTHPLELSPSGMRALVDLAMDRIAAHVASLPAQPSADTEGAAALARSLKEPLPERGAPFESLLDLLFDVAIPKSFNTAGPGYLAYIPGGGLLHSAVADLIANATNRYVGVFAAAPALVQLETNVVRWFCQLVGYPPSAGGVLTSGGSLSILSALITARRERLPEDFLKGTLYVSEETHHSIQKAAMLAGFPVANVREIPSDDRFRIRLDLLEQRLDEDARAGFQPFLVVGNAGTTNTGAVDDLAALADIAERRRLWMHVDGAYGGFFAMTERGRKTLAGIERADSIALDPHKSLFLPYGTGSLIVKDPVGLRRAHSLHADYLPTMQDDPDLVDFCEISPELSRDFRGLRVWLPMKLLGAGPFRDALDEKLDLALFAADELRKVDGVELVAPPQLSLLAFRLTKPGLSRDELNALNRDFLNRVNGRKRVYITGTVHRGRFLPRICVLSFRTHRDRMEMALEDIRQAARDLLA